MVEVEEGMKGRTNHKPSLTNVGEYLQGCNRVAVKLDWLEIKKYEHVTILRGKGITSMFGGGVRASPTSVPTRSTERFPQMDKAFALASFPRFGHSHTHDMKHALLIFTDK
jgi:hypothetical protein